MIKKLLLGFLLLLSTSAFAESICEGYRPLHTAFGLSGAHWSCSCDGCHKGGVWKGTPTTCALCHNGSRPPAIGKSPNHIPTTVDCSSCHLTIIFTPASMNHTGMSGICSTCHNGSYTSQGARGKSFNHIPTTLECDTCHKTTGFDVSWKHQGVIPGTCSTCHNGSYALGKSSRHIPTTVECDTCHSGYSTFTTGIYTHTGVETCFLCHDNAHAGAVGKNALHPTTGNDCGSCHSITGWPCRSGYLDLFKRWFA